MKKEIQYFVWVLGLGFSLIAYGHIAFATKGSVRTMLDIIKTIDARVYDIHKNLRRE